MAGATGRFHQLAVGFGGCLIAPMSPSAGFCEICLPSATLPFDGKRSALEDNWIKGQVGSEHGIGSTTRVLQNPTIVASLITELLIPICSRQNTD